MNIKPSNSTSFNNIPSEQANKSFGNATENKLTFDNIRSFRQQFEKNAEPLLSVLGEEHHQTLMVAMYEGTEQLLNQNVSEFAVMEYLEGLKINAQELNTRNISGEKYQSTLLEQSDIAVRQMVHST